MKEMVTEKVTPSFKAERLLRQALEEITYEGYAPHHRSRPKGACDGHGCGVGWAGRRVFVRGCCGVGEWAWASGTGHACR